MHLPTRADRPESARAARTRRELLAGTARLTAAGLLGSVATPLSPLTQRPALASEPPPPTTPALELPDALADADYWAFADWLQADLEARWDPVHQIYGPDARVNAMMLITHSLAALLGHEGPTRQDERARLLAARLLRSPPYLPGGAVSTYGPGQRHTPGFVLSMFEADSDQHVAIDPEICEGLVYAWRARGQLGLEAGVVTAIEQAVAGVAAGRFYRYPSVRLNQCNWNGEMYAYAAELAGRTDLLLDDYRRQLSRFLVGCRTPTRPWRITNLSPSYSFHRNPLADLDAGENIESAEYANLVIGIVARYAAARAAGMPAPPAEQLRTLRAWIARALPAYWTHAGYLNWDTGVHPGRWNTGHYWGFVLDGVVAIATAPTELRDPLHGEWAKHIFDRAFGTYVRLARERGGKARIPHSPLFTHRPDTEPAHLLFAVRFQSQAARAVHLGLGRARSRRPPALYAFDPSIGRLAVTTPSYNTAVVAVSNGAFPYGGIELARLFDGEQRIVAGVGPHGAEGFGIAIADDKRVVLDSQTPRRSAGAAPPLELTRSPRGVVRAGAHYPEHPYAGPFEHLQCVGAIEGDGVSIQTTHEFTPGLIRTTWRIHREPAGRALSVTARFPAWGKDARIAPVPRRGSAAALTVAGVQLERVAHFAVRCGESQSGYLLRLTGAPPESRARVVATAAQSSNPSPGRQLIVLLADGAGWRELSLSAEIVPGAA